MCGFKGIKKCVQLCMTHHEFEWFAVLVELTIRMVGRSPVQCLIHHAIYSRSICFLDPKPSIIRTHFPSYRKLFVSLNPIQWTLPQLGTIASKNVTLCHACILMAFNIIHSQIPRESLCNASSFAAPFQLHVAPFPVSSATTRFGFARKT